MGKADALLKDLGGNLAESIGVRTGSFRAHPSHSTTEIPTVSPKDGFTRNRAAGEMLLENIIPDPSQPRKEFEPGAIERLSESIKSRGVLQPLRVRWNPELGKHIILVGERRYRASLLAGLTSVPCIFVETELTQAEILEEQLVENLLREDLNAVEQATSFRRYMEIVGCHAKDLAQLLKVSPSTVTRALSLLTLPEPIQEQIAQGELPAKSGFEIAKLKSVPAQEALAERIITEKLTADDAAKVVRQKKGKPTSKGRGASETYRVTSGFKVVVTSSKKATHEDFVEALSQALSMAQAKST